MKSVRRAGPTSRFACVQSIARPLLRAASLLGLAAIVAGCASPNHRAPVEERPVAGRSVRSMDPAVSLGPNEAVVPPLPGAENAGKPGYYTVRPGDTMIRIGLETGQNWKDVVRWNNLENPNLIETGQVLRVVPPGVDPTEPAARPVATARDASSGQPTAATRRVRCGTSRKHPAAAAARGRCAAASGTRDTSTGASASGRRQ